MFGLGFDLGFETVSRRPQNRCAFPRAPHRGAWRRRWESPRQRFMITSASLDCGCIRSVYLILLLLYLSNTHNCLLYSTTQVYCHRIRLYTIQGAKGSPPQPVREVDPLPLATKCPSQAFKPIIVFLTSHGSFVHQFGGAIRLKHQSQQVNTFLMLPSIQTLLPTRRSTTKE